MDTKASNSSENKLNIQISKSRAELPHIIVSGLVIIIIGLFHYGFFGWPGFAISVSIILAIGIFLLRKHRGPYFVQVDEKGIRWRNNLFSAYKNIPWDYLQRIDYLEYEINFMLKETAQVISFGTSNITEEQAEELKQSISNLLEARESGLPD